MTQPSETLNKRMALPLDVQRLWKLDVLSRMGVGSPEGTPVTMGTVARYAIDKLASEVSQEPGFSERLQEIATEIDRLAPHGHAALPTTIDWSMPDLSADSPSVIPMGSTPRIFIQVEEQ